MGGREGEGGGRRGWEAGCVKYGWKDGCWVGGCVGRWMEGTRIPSQGLTKAELLGRMLGLGPFWGDGQRGGGAAAPGPPATAWGSCAPHTVLTLSRTVCLLPSKSHPVPSLPTPAWNPQPAGSGHQMWAGTNEPHPLVNNWLRLWPPVTDGTRDNGANRPLAQGLGDPGTLSQAGGGRGCPADTGLPTPSSHAWQLPGDTHVRHLQLQSRGPSPGMGGGGGVLGSGRGLCWAQLLQQKEE